MGYDNLTTEQRIDFIQDIATGLGKTYRSLLDDAYVNTINKEHRNFLKEDDYFGDDYEQMVRGYELIFDVLPFMIQALNAERKLLEEELMLDDDA